MTYGKSMAVWGALALTSAFAGQASAGCGGTDSAQGFEASRFTLGDGGALKVALKGGPDYSAWRFNKDIGKWQYSIVGMWKFDFVAKGNAGIPDGAPIDSGYVVWHSDGTELMNSGRAPATGSFCMGVWKTTAPGKYKLNHVALSWNDTVNFTGPTGIREEITVARSGDSYSGTFTLDQYTPDGKPMSPPVHVIGTVTATRVTVD